MFLPITVLGFWLIQELVNRHSALVWLVGCSFFFYAYWNPVYILLIIASIGFNYFVGYRLSSVSGEVGFRRKILFVGIICNLGLLGYFKYANFFMDGVNKALGLSVQIDAVVLPLAISFFTFQQIAYLVDSYRDVTQERNFINYCLFVTFFPQLIAGPIVHHKKMMPQFSDHAHQHFQLSNFSGGLTLFFIGLAKKVIIADSISDYPNVVFDNVLRGDSLNILEAWVGTLAYTFQLYFDFSGYSDMAIGLALLFGIRLPMNFNSPYKALNTADFWRRWHITLGEFLRDYLYIPLGGNRRGIGRLYFSLMATMGLSGLWHGAGWTFILWGIQQGFFHWIFLSWKLFKHKSRRMFQLPAKLQGMLAVFLTFMAWTVGMVLFRAESLEVAGSFYQSMFGLNGFAVEIPYVHEGYDIEDSIKLIGICFFIVWCLPNSLQIMKDIEPVVNWPDTSQAFTAPLRFFRWVKWRPSRLVACIVSPIVIYTLISMNKVKEFLYFQF